jgi:hypothetical protein
MELFSFLFLLSPPHNFNHFFYSHILEICLVSSGWSSAYRLRLWYTPVRLGISLTTVKHRSSNITILLLPAVTNCDIVSKTTRQRQQKSQLQISFFFTSNLTHTPVETLITTNGTLLIQRIWVQHLLESPAPTTGTISKITTTIAQSISIQSRS